MLRNTVAVLLMLGAGMSQALANDDATIAARKAVMKEVGGSLRSLAGIVKDGSLPSNEGAEKAKVIVVASGKAVEAFKPKVLAGASEKTTVTPAVWDKWADFEAGLKDLGTKAQAVSVAMAGSDKAAVAAAMGALQGTCKSCHDSFRTK